VYRKPSCVKSTNARYLIIYEIPSYMDWHAHIFVMHCLVFIRFYYHGQWRDKISKYVHYPINELNMSPYVVGDQQPRKYHLYAITVSGKHNSTFLLCQSILFSISRTTLGHYMEAIVRYWLITAQDKLQSFLCRYRLLSTSI